MNEAGIRKSVTSSVIHPLKPIREDVQMIYEYNVAQNVRQPYS